MPDDDRTPLDELLDELPPRTTIDYMRDLRLAVLVLWDGVLDGLAPYVTPHLDRLSAYLKSGDHHGQ